MQVIFAGSVSWFIPAPPKPRKDGTFKRNDDGSLKMASVPVYSQRIAIDTVLGVKVYSYNRKLGVWTSPAAKGDKYKETLTSERICAICGVGAYNKAISSGHKEGIPPSEFKALLVQDNNSEYVRNCNRFGIALDIGWKGKKERVQDWSKVLKFTH